MMMVSITYYGVLIAAVVIAVVSAVFFRVYQVCTLIMHDVMTAAVVAKHMEPEKLPAVAYIIQGTKIEIL